jgi:hypothetical protein
VPYFLTPAFFAGFSERFANDMLMSIGGRPDGVSRRDGSRHGR